MHLGTGPRAKETISGMVYRGHSISPFLRMAYPVNETMDTPSRPGHIAITP